MAQAKGPTQYRNSDPNNHGPGSFKSAAEKKVACDRCRGQKLRCIWVDGKIGQCRRCARANVVCMRLPPRPMGRPSRPTRRCDSRSRRDQVQVPLKDPQWAGPMTSHSLHVGSYTPMDKDDIDNQDALTEGTGNDFDDTDGGNTIHSSTDCLLNGQVFHFSSEGLPRSDMMHIDDNLGELDDTSFCDYSSLMQNAIDSDGTPTFCSDDTSNPSLHNDPIMYPNGPATPQFVPPDFISEGNDDMDEDIDDKSLSFVHKLLRLNLALYKNLKQMNTGQGKSPSSVMTSMPLEPSPKSNPKAVMEPTGMIGQLLSLTDQFTTLLGQLGFLAHSHRNDDSETDTTSSHSFMSVTNSLGHASQRDRSHGISKVSQWKQHDPSITLLVLSCYLHLKEGHSRSRRVLEQMMSQGVESGGLPELLPNLVIEGFSLAGHGRLQLGMTAKLCEQMFSSIGPCLGLHQKLCDVAADGSDELVEKIWGLFGRELSP